MEHDISPAFIQIGYSSAYGRHKARIPSVPLIENIGASDGALSHWTFDLRGAAIDVNVEDAVDDFIALWKAVVPTTTMIDDVVLYKKIDADNPALPVASKLYSAAGTYVDGAAITDKATQRTFTWRTEAFGMMKLVFLDVPVQNFAKSRNLSGVASWVALNAYVVADVSWLSGRDGGRPTTFIGTSSDLNDRLQRAYNR